MTNSVLEVMIFQYVFITCFLSTPISLLGTGNNSFSLDMAFMISDVNMSVRCDFNYSLIQEQINILVS